MKTRQFMLKLVECDNEYHQVESRDYDLENGLVRYEKAIYDIELGLWIVKLSHIQKGLETWKGYKTYEKLSVKDMIPLVRENTHFMKEIEKARINAKKVRPIVNPLENDKTLFDL